MSDPLALTPGPPSSSVDASLLVPPTSTSAINNIPISPSAFYSQSTRTCSRPVTPPQNAPNSISTPVSNKTSGSHNYASDTHNRDSANHRLAQETTGLFLGAMPPRPFLDKFLPISPGTPRCPKAKKTFERVLSAEKELQMYEPFVSMILLTVSPGLHFVW
jgi:hypothetical protein